MNTFVKNNNLLLSRPPWTPANLGLGLVLWLDASDSSSITLNGSNVSQWNDKSGNNNHVLQSVEANQPSYEIAGLNNRPALNFTNNVMSTNTNPFGSTINDAFVAVVHKIDSIQSGTLFSLSGSVSLPVYAYRWQAHAPWSFKNSVIFDCGGNASPNRIQAASYGEVGDIIMSEFYCSISDNVQQVWKNGSLFIGDNSGHSVPTELGIFIGGIGTTYQDTTIAEAVVINGTITSQNRQKIEGYLAHKWGLTSNLPNDHPYKLIAP